MVKRKTPSELRGEQLKRESVEDLTDDEVSPSAGSAKDTQLIGEVFSGKKSMFRIVSKEQTSSNLKNETNEKFLSVADLSSSAVVGRSSSGAAAAAGIDMGQALKGLASLVNSTEPTIAGDGSGKSKSKCSCNAYISQSIRGLRSLLRERDLCFSMPLCRSKVDQEVTTSEDLVELSEIEKQNFAETRRQRSSDVDNSPESLLVFSGNNNVHGSYDLILNYKTLLTSLSGVEDVPVLCSPVPFQNSAMTSPDIKCMEMTRAEDIAQVSSNGPFYSIEVKDAIIPPWIICSICALMMGSQGRRNFEASFVTKPLSIGLNVALESICDNSFGIPKAVVTSSLSSCTLKSVNYCDDSYIASLSSIV